MEVEIRTCISHTCVLVDFVLLTWEKVCMRRVLNSALAYSRVWLSWDDLCGWQDVKIQLLTLFSACYVYVFFRGHFVSMLVPYTVKQTDKVIRKGGWQTDRQTDRQSCAIFDHSRTPQAEWKLQKQRQVGTRHPPSASIDSVITIDRNARAGLCQRVTIVLIVPIKTLMSSTCISQVSVPAVLRHVEVSSSCTSHLFVAVLPPPPLYPSTALTSM